MGKYKQLDIVKKSQIVLLNSQGVSNREISRRFECDEATIRRFLKKFKESGEMSRKPGSGRKRCTTTRTDNKIKMSALRNRFVTAPEITAEIEKTTGLTLSVSTVQRRLNEVGLFAFRTAKKPLLTREMRRIRLEWAKERQNWTVNDWNRVIFSDESKFKLWGSDGKTTVRRRKKERLKDECVISRPKRSEGVMVWGSITGRGVGRLIIVEGTVNASQYEKIIMDGVLPTIDQLSEYESDIVFQDDSAPCHRAKTIQKLKEELRIISLPWPGNSPDLNPIEHVWHKIGKEIQKQKPTSVPNLKNFIEKVFFDEIDVKYITKLYESMPNRLQAVITAKGGHTKY